jgi:tRNA A-37 threonylcarbamoyl transferase component Bud32
MILLPRFSLAIYPRSANFVMVVMGYVDGKQLFCGFLHEAPPGALSKVSEALRTLHANDLVFSDLRSPNILVTDQYDTGVER